MLFKVGQRVRCIASTKGNEGREGIVLGFDTAGSREDRLAHWVVRLDGRDSDRPVEPYAGGWWCRDSDIAPLTNPAADAFIERIKKLKPYDEPTVQPRVFESNFK